MTKANKPSKAETRLTRARSQLILRQPFYGTLALYLQAIEAPDKAQTMATDGKALFYNPAFVESLSDAELQGVIAHEVTHCAYRHHTRRGNRNPKRWNEAADYAINRDLTSGGFTLPKEALLDARFGQLGAEDIYRILDSESDKEQEQQSGQGQGGNNGADGSGNLPDAQSSPCPDTGRCGGFFDPAPSHDPEAIAESDSDWQQRTIQAAAIASASGCGKMPAGISRLVDAARQVDSSWQSALDRFIDSRCKSESTWSRPNRRMLSLGHYLPGATYKGISHLVVGLDTSGSIDESLLGKYLAQIQTALDSGSIERLTILDCDSSLNAIHEYGKGDSIALESQGGGGTSFAPVFKWCEDNAETVTALLYFTDLDSSDYGTEPEFPVLWCAYGDPRSLDYFIKRVPFGEVITITD